jgi:lipopolysaccharide export system ATP-binding protein
MRSAKTSTDDSPTPPVRHTDKSSKYCPAPKLPNTTGLADTHNTDTKTTGAPLLETQRLVKRYSGRTVVDEVSITIERRSIVGLLGRNGAGKTTTFRMIIGMIMPNSGAVTFDGHDMTKMPMYKRARLGMGYLSQEPSIFQRLSVRDNLYAILETMALTSAERTRRANLLIERFGLTEVAGSQGRFLSGGERRKLEIARAMVTDAHHFLVLADNVDIVDILGRIKFKKGIVVNIIIKPL